MALMSAADSPLAPARLLRVTVLTLSLAVFAAVVAFVSWLLHDGRRARALNREARPLARADAHTLAGAAQFLIDGRAVATEFATLDRRLAVQAGFAWLAGAVVIALALAWAFRRLAAANDALAARTEDLSRANRELVLA